MWSSDLKDLRCQAIKLFKYYKSRQTAAAYQAYSIAKLSFHKQCKAAKKLILVNQCQNLVENIKLNGISELFKLFRSKHNSAACPISPEILREASMKLFACFPTPEFNVIPSCIDPLNPLITTINSTEINVIQKTLKSRAPSLSGFSPLQVANLVPYLGNVLVDIFNDALISGKFPLNWLESCLFFIYKKGEKADPSNYRTISIENPFLKCFMKIIQRRASVC